MTRSKHVPLGARSPQILSERRSRKSVPEKVEKIVGGHHKSNPRHKKNTKKMQNDKHQLPNRVRAPVFASPLDLLWFSFWTRELFHQGSLIPFRDFSCFLLLEMFWRFLKISQPCLKDASYTYSYRNLWDVWRAESLTEAMISENTLEGCPSAAESHSSLV